MFFEHPVTIFHHLTPSYQIEHPTRMWVLLPWSAQRIVSSPKVDKETVLKGRLAKFKSVILFTFYRQSWTNVWLHLVICIYPQFIIVTVTIRWSFLKYYYFCAQNLPNQVNQSHNVFMFVSFPAAFCSFLFCIITITIYMLHHRIGKYMIISWRTCWVGFFVRLIVFNLSLGLKIECGAKIKTYQTIPDLGQKKREKINWQS